MAKKTKKNIFNKSERYFGVVLEKMDSNIQSFLDGHQTLDKKIDNLKDNIDGRFKEVDYKFDIVFEKFNDVDAQLNDIKDELHIIRNDLKEKVSRDEFVLLEKRVMALERAKK
ncbi:hypothetical protein M1513_01665 [Patescibacteria group bacterium]|nr:hypothetical protein [Patescibacteria group bacterium]MCL5733318.1 hypothetical protein [Patescibacteria group bacterium]